MISRRLFVSLWLGVCLFCFLGTGSSETAADDQLREHLVEILSNLQNNTYVHKFVICCSVFAYFYYTNLYNC